MKDIKIHHALLLAFSLSVALGVPINASGAETTGGDKSSSSTSESTQGDKGAAGSSSSQQGSGEKKGSGGSEPECN